MIDQLRQMAIFSKAIDHGSFRAAARELRLSPSVVSHHISQLEEHLGVALVYRSTRRLSLTRDGERLLVTTRKMLEAVETDLLELTSSASEPSGEIRLTAPSVLSQSKFTEAITAFLNNYPKINVFLDFSDTRRELIRDGFDIAIRMGVERKRSPTSKQLFEVDRRLVASADYIANAPPVAEPKDILQLNWLGLAPVENLPVTLTRTGQKAGITVKPQASIVTNDAQALYRLSKAGAGVAAVPEYLAADDVNSGLVKWVLPDWKLQPVQVYANWPSNAPKDGLIRLLLNHLSGHLSEHYGRS